MKTAYSEQVAGTFLDTAAEQFGDARMTAAEFGALRELHRAHGRKREDTLAAITKEGYPIPKKITPEMVALTGAAHACGVAINLAETRGIKGRDSTFESYITKNRFDRFVALHLPNKLRSAWNQPIPREAGHENPAVVYPHGVDYNLIHGIAKPHRYFPAQTARYLEFARLGKLDTNTAKQFGITPETDLSAFGVRWDVLIPTIEEATSLVGLSAALSTEIANQLLHNGLSAEQVAAVLDKGYSLSGMLQEHGSIDQAKETYQALREQLADTGTTKQVADLLPATIPGFVD